jgi:hypothetical protein
MCRELQRPLRLLLAACEQQAAPAAAAAPDIWHPLGDCACIYLLNAKPAGHLTPAVCHLYAHPSFCHNTQLTHEAHIRVLCVSTAADEQQP